MQLYTVTVDANEATTVTNTLVFATEAEVYTWLRSTYPVGHEGYTDDQFLSALSADGTIMVQIDVHQIPDSSLIDAGYVVQNFSPAGLDDFFAANDDYDEVEVWKTLTPEQRIEASQTIANWYVAEDGSYDHLVTDAIISGIDVYAKEQLS